MRFLKHNLLKDEGINPFQLQLFRLLNGRKIRLRDRNMRLLNNLNCTIYTGFTLELNGYRNID